MWAGLRPLLAPPSGAIEATSRLSRDFAIEVAPSGLITVAGGKWTSYRRMAEVLVDRVEREAGWERRPSRTRELPLVGAPPMRPARAAGPPGPPDPRGTERPLVDALARPGEGPLCPDFDLVPADVRFAARHEFARAGLDVLARRHRLLLLDAARTAEVAGQVATLLSGELGRDAAWVRADTEATLQAVRLHLPAGK
jgi:glycerol-3-phosphate dehydrogenase